MTDRSAPTHLCINICTQVSLCFEHVDQPQTIVLIDRAVVDGNKQWVLVCVLLGVLVCVLLESGERYVRV